MDTLTQKDMKEIYDALPEDVQEILFAPETMDVYDQIKNRYGLSAEQRKALSMESGLVLMGLTEPRQYVLRLADMLSIPRDKAAFIAQEVNRGVFHLVRDSLKIIHQPAMVTQEAVTQPAPASDRPLVPPPPRSTASSLDQKLGGTFRVPTPPQANVPNYSIPSIPLSVPPPAPRPPSTTPKATDPYRESPL